MCVCTDSNKVGVTLGGLSMYVSILFVCYEVCFDLIYFLWTNLICQDFTFTPSLFKRHFPTSDTNY